MLVISFQNKYGAYEVYSHYIFTNIITKLQSAKKSFLSLMYLLKYSPMYSPTW